MRKPRYTEEQIIGIVKETAAVVTVADLIRKHGIRDAVVLPLEGQLTAC